MVGITAYNFHHTTSLQATIFSLCHLSLAPLLHIRSNRSLFTSLVWTLLGTSIWVALYVYGTIYLTRFWRKLYMISTGTTSLLSTNVLVFVPGPELVWALSVHPNSLQILSLYYVFTLAASHVNAVRLCYAYNLTLHWMEHWHCMVWHWKVLLLLLMLGFPAICRAQIKRCITCT